MSELAGQTLGSYRVLDPIGRGGMGAVYLGEHAVIGRRVAIKVLLPELVGEPERLKRFFNEARAAAQVRHPSIVDVLDFGTQDDISYLVMEYLEGESVRTRLSRAGVLPEIAVRRLGRQVASALAAAHARHIIHRDLKPDNLFLIQDEDVLGKERIKVLDFGIAKLLTDGGDRAVHTRDGSVLGSVGYMAPEQARGDSELDERADVYALGCVLFEMLCGRRLFPARSPTEMRWAQAFSPLPSPRLHAPAISPDLEAIIVRMLSQSPSARFASMSEIVVALDSAAPAPDAEEDGDASSDGAPAIPPRRVAAMPGRPGTSRMDRLPGAFNGDQASASTETAQSANSRRRGISRVSGLAPTAMMGAALIILFSLRSAESSDVIEPRSPSPVQAAGPARPSSPVVTSSPIMGRPPGSSAPLPASESRRDSEAIGRDDGPVQGDRGRRRKAARRQKVSRVDCTPSSFAQLDVATSVDLRSIRTSLIRLRHCFAAGQIDATTFKLLQESLLGQL